MHLYSLAGFVLRSSFNQFLTTVFELDELAEDLINGRNIRLSQIVYFNDDELQPSKPEVTISVRVNRICNTCCVCG